MATTPSTLRAGDSTSIQWDGTQFASTNVMSVTAVSGSSTGFRSTLCYFDSIFIIYFFAATIGTVSATAGTLTWSVPIDIATANQWTIELQAKRDATSGAPSYTHSSGSFTILRKYSSDLARRSTFLLTFLFLLFIF